MAELEAGSVGNGVVGSKVQRGMTGKCGGPGKMGGSQNMGRPHD